MKKQKTESIVAAYRLICEAKLNKMEDSDKFLLIRIARKLKKTATDFNDFLQDAQKKLKPDGFDAITFKIQNKEELTYEENNKVVKYNQDVSECVKDELEKEVELDFEPLSEEAFARFVSSNDFSVSDILVINDIIA